MDNRKCIDCLNDIIVNYIEIKPCQHSLCYNCISLKLITKSINRYLDKQTTTFRFNCAKCSHSISISYEEIDKILSITTKAEQKAKKTNVKEAYCTQHAAIFDHYCHCCKGNICKECISNDHKYHQWISIKEYKLKLRKVSSNWIHKSYSDLDQSLRKNCESAVAKLKGSYDELNAKISNAINELRAYSTQIVNEKEEKLKAVKYFNEIIKKVYKRYYSDIEDIDFKDINEVKYLSKIKYEYVKMSFKPFTYLQKEKDNKKSNEDILNFPKVKPPMINYCFIRLNKVSITFSSQTRRVKECLNIINTRNPVGNVLFLNENEIYFSSGSFLLDSKDKNIQIYNIKQRKFDIIETHHSNSVLCLCDISNNRIASGSYDNTIKLWSLSNYKEEATLIGHKGSITTLKLWKKDMLISGSNDSSIRVWDLLTMKCLNSYSAQKEGVFCLCLIDNMLYCGGNEKDIKVLSLADPSVDDTSCISIKQIGVLKGHLNWVFAICSNKGSKVKRIASGSKDSSIRIWKKSKGKCIATLTGHNYYITDLAYLLDNRLASASKDKTIRLWNMNTMICEIVLQAQEGPLTLSVLPDGRLMSGLRDNMIRIWG